MPRIIGPTVQAFEVCCAIFRDATQDAELRFAACHVALVIQHLGAHARAGLDARALAGIARSDASEGCHVHKTH